MVPGTRAEQAAAGRQLRSPGDMCGLAHLHRAGSCEHFQIQLNGNRGVQLAARQQRVFGAQKQMADVPVRPSVVTPAEEKTEWAASLGAAQPLATHLHLQFLSHWSPAVVEG